MRGLLQRTVGPPLERVFDYFEQSVSLDDHRRLAAEIAAEVGARERVAASELASLESAFCADSYESGDLEQLVHRVHLLGCEAAPGAGPGVAFDSAAFADPCWQDDPRRIRELQNMAGRALAALATGALPIDEGDRLLGELARHFAPRLWFPKRGVLYGSANLLRALIRTASAPNSATRDYTREVCDRLLRHLEVRREDYLPFRPDSRPADACDELERLRFTAALLDATELFDDARYLNAALKANDWHLRALRSRSETQGLARLYYLHGFERQEALLRARFGEPA